MKTFSVGDKVWIAKCGAEQIKKICPICFGKKKVTLILGDESAVELDCENYGIGFDGPRGFVTEYEYSENAIQRTITELRINRDVTGDKIEYVFASGEGWNYSNNQNEIFETQEEALVECAKKTEQLELAQDTQASHLKKYRNKNYAYNAGYHLREAKRARGQVEYHERKAVLCKAKVRAEKESKLISE